MPNSRLIALGRSVLAAALAGALLAATPALAQGFPDEWFFTDDQGERLAEHTGFEGNAAPPLTVTDWVNGEVTPENLEGHILVIDFWATWCQPCIAAIPHNNQLAQAYAGEGVRFIAVCASGDPGQMPGILEEHDAQYPAAFTDGEQVATDWPIAFFPTYAVVDATGTVRAIGLKPDSIESVLDELLEEQSQATGRARIQRRWLEGDAASRERLAKLEANADRPPAIEADQWVNAGEQGLTPEDLEGKVVLISFGATWAAPWLDAIETLNALHDDYREQGLVVVGICATLEGFALPKVAQQYEIAFPAGIDLENRTNRAFGPNGYPDYYLLDREGHLRIADLHHNHLREAIEALLAEQPAEASDTDDEDAESPIENANGDTTQSEESNPE